MRSQITGDARDTAEETEEQREEKRVVVDTALLKCYVLCKNPLKLSEHVALPAPLCRCNVAESTDFLLRHEKTEEAVELYQSHGTSGVHPLHPPPTLVGV